MFASTFHWTLLLASSSERLRQSLYFCHQSPVVSVILCLGLWFPGSSYEPKTTTIPCHIALPFFRTTASRNFRFQDVSALTSMKIISVDYHTFSNFKDFKTLCFLILPLHISSDIVRPSIIPHKLSFIIYFKAVSVNFNKS